MDQEGLDVKSNTLRMIVLIVGLVMSSLAHATDWNAQDYDLYPGDFNGDGKTDILYVAKDPAKLSGIATSDGVQPITVWQTWPSNYLNIDWSRNQYNVIIGDFNGDGKADIFLQRATPGDSYLLITDSTKRISAISQAIQNDALGFVWSADQHKIVAGSFSGDFGADGIHRRAGLFLQATSASGQSAVISTDINGQFTANSSIQGNWNDTNFGFNWSTQSSIVYVGDFNGDGKADLLVQAKPKFVMIDYDVTFPVPTYLPNKNGLVLSAGGPNPFVQTGVQQWSRMTNGTFTNGVDWSPLANTLVLGNFNNDGKTDILFQARYGSGTSYLLTAASTGTTVFPSTTSASIVNSNISLTSDSNHLIAVNFAGTPVMGLYFQTLTPSGTNNLTNQFSTSIIATSQSYSVAATNYLVPIGNVSVATSVGRTSGSFDVSADGAASYSIPIEVPKNAGGVQPKLSLTYNSHSGNGEYGPGWSLSGLGAITRCNRTVAQDGYAAPVTLDYNDVFCINGKRMRLFTGGWGIDGSTYQTELADFSLIVAHSAAGNGPAYFTVYGKNGLIYEYGNNDFSPYYGTGSYAISNAGILATGSSTASQWLLDKVSDRSNNYYLVNYGSGAANSRAIGIPQHIGYSSPIGGGVGVTFDASSTSYPVKIGYVAGTLVKNTNLITAIRTDSRTYSFSYETSSAIPRARLKAVQECNYGGGSCLPATQITYQNGLAGVSTAASIVVTDADKIYGAYDIDGDGRDDVVYSSAGLIYVAFATPTGYSSGFNTTASASASKVLSKDLTGTGKVGIFADLGGTWTYYSWNGSGFVAVPSVSDQGASNYSTLADLNGDGLADLVYWQNNYIWVRLNTSANGMLAFSSNPTQAVSFTGFNTGGWSFANQFNQPSDRKGVVDLNGDGREDLLLSYATVSSGHVVHGGIAYLASGSVASPTLTGAMSLGYTYFHGHFNSDRCTDIAYGQVVYVSGCDGAIAQQITIPSGTLMGMADWDGDGRDDIIVNNGGTLGVYLSQGDNLNGTIVTTSISATAPLFIALDQDGDGQDDFGFISSLTSSASFSYNVHNSAGVLPDLVSSITDGYGVTVSPTYVPITQNNYTALNDGSYPDRDYVGPLYVVNQLSASDGVGGTYTRSYWYWGAHTNLQGRGFEGFAEKQTTDSRTGIAELQYYRRDFPYIGQPYQTVKKQSNGKTITSSLLSYDSTVLSYLPSSTYIWVNGNFQPGLSAPAVIFPHVNNSSGSQYQVGGSSDGGLLTSTAGTYSYDNFGNLTASALSATDNDSNSPTANKTWTTTTTSHYSIDAAYTPNVGSNWCVGLPIDTSVSKTTNNNELVVTRNQAFTVDSPHCRAKQVVTEPNSSYQVTTDYEYDGYGNIHIMTVTGAGMAPRASTITWGGVSSNNAASGTALAGGAFPNTVQNALGQTTTKLFDRSGNQVKETDANNLTTTWTYDFLNRKTSEKRPDGTSTTWNYYDCTKFSGGCLNANNKMVVVTTVLNNDSTVQSYQLNYLDQFNRNLESKTPTFAGSYSQTDVQYDPLGRITQQSLPCAGSCPSYWMTFNYDALNRAIQVQRPVNSYAGKTWCDPKIVPAVTGCQGSTISYLGRTTITTDAKGKQSTKITDVNGWLRRSADNNGYYQNFGYDAWGSLTSVIDSNSKPLFSATYVYGIQPFQTSKADINSATAWILTPNALGEVVSYTDANNNTFSTLFDALSRPYQRSNATEGTTQWNWGAAATSYNVARLQSISSPGYSEVYTYDTLGRLSNKHIVSDAPYNYDYTYNGNTGLLDTLSYPATSTTPTPAYRLKLQYGYRFGVLSQVQDANAGTVFWQIETTNPRGQVLQEKLGNNIVTNRSFDPVTGWVASIQSGAGSGYGVQNESYFYDLMGNVTQRQNNNVGLTENVYYDDLYRLDHSTLTSGGATATNLQMCYDNPTAGTCNNTLPGPGNITSRSDLANGALWAYDPAHIHQVKQAGDSSHTYSYDNNGNVTSRSGNSIVWSPSNYPIQINGASESIALAYDANHLRYLQVYTSGSITETTTYVGGLLEKVTVGGVDDYRHSIHAGSKVVAILSSKSNGTNTTHYMLEDHQGSAAKITDGAGGVYASESFTAFGNRRDATSWSGSPSASDLSAINGVSREGYTGQTALGNMGLNHMNGRVEDSITGRFLSIDPNVTDPGNTQNYNRYSYGLNNPLKFTDPTGLDTCDSEYEDCCGDYCDYQYPFPNTDDYTDTTTDNNDNWHSDPFYNPGDNLFGNPTFPGDSTSGLFDSGTNGSIFTGGNGDTMEEVVITAERPLEDQAAKTVDTHWYSPIVNFLSGVFTSQGTMTSNGIPVRSNMPSTYRYTQPGEKSYRYESGNSAYSKVNPDGSVDPGTYAAPASDGKIPPEQLNDYYNLPDPGIARTQSFEINPPSGTLVVGPRPVEGGIGNEVIYPGGVPAGSAVPIEPIVEFPIVF
jgi:RHS repeat-associated protein